jgi:spermidine/putrescine transport system permease protein
MNTDIRRLPGFSSIAVLAFVFLYAPMASLILYSFNDGKSVGLWKGFSLAWYRSVLTDDRVMAATFLSLEVALFASSVATALALLAAIAMTRGPVFRFQGVVYALINHPLVVPEIVIAVALLIVVGFLKAVTGYGGIGFILLAHAAFCVPLAYLPIQARLEGRDDDLDRAAADLYASEMQIFRRVTLPLLAPGIVAGFMLSFVSSLDNVLITLFLAGPNQETLPLYVFGQMRRGVTPELNVISTLFLGVSALLVGAFFFLNRKR